MERNAVMVATGSFWVAGLTIFLCFSKLCDDWNSEEFLSSELYRKRNRLFLSELDVANATNSQSKRHNPQEKRLTLLIDHLHGP